MTDSLRRGARSKVPSDSPNSVLQPEVFQPYVQHLAALLKAGVSNGGATMQAELVAALDGQPSRELRKLYTIDSLRNTGTYFTGSELASRLVTSFKSVPPSVTQVVDPACGAGDLLVACARHLPLQSDLTRTLNDWGARLAGFDINSAFVEATRYRLALLAVERIGAAARNLSKELSLPHLFPQIRSRSGMEDWNLPSSPTLIVVNPPFSYCEAAKGCTWASGRVSQAAMFMDNCIKNAVEGTRLLAILPDVLRTGTRYERWRRMVAEKALVHSVEIAGQFDDLTEISVFLLELEVCKPEKDQDVSWARPAQSAKSMIKDLFDVRVGPVVPFRLDGRGSWFPYAHSKELQPWQTLRQLDQHIRFKGTTYKPPFVAIRRTSKADYHVRCIGTIVAGKKPIAIDNHLLVAIPHDKKLGTCKKLLEVLKQDSTSIWMNERIRCRHLTVSSIGDLPWPEE
jgi:N-6 DNA Methylase